MLRKLLFCALVTATVGTGSVQAQDLGPFPVNRRREPPDKNLITDARLTTTGFAFLKMTNNARSAAMGDAFSAVGNDISALYYNPAGITLMETQRAVQVGYTTWIVGSTIGTAAFAVKTQVATFGINAIFYSTEEFEERTSTNPGGTGRMVRATDTAVGITVAKQLTDKLSFGAQMRWVKEDLDLVSFQTVDVNVGTVFYTGYRSTRLSMALRNLGADREVVALKARVPTVFYFAGAGEVYGNLGDPFSLTLSAEQAYYTDYAARYYMGAEAWVNNMLALRGGYKTGHTNEDWSLGVGLKHDIGGSRLKIDVSISHAEVLDENPFRLSVSYGF